MAMSVKGEVNPLRLVHIRRAWGQVWHILKDFHPNRARRLAHEQASEFLSRPRKPKNVRWLEVSQNLKKKRWLTRINLGVEAQERIPRREHRWANP